MDKKRLEAFVKLVEFGAFRLTAEHLQVTQPALSQMIARLEKEVGLKLIDRSTRPVSTTEAGREFYFRSHKVLDAMLSIEELVYDAKEAKVGRVRIGIVPALMFAEPAKGIRSFRNKHEQAEVHISSMATANLIDELNGGSIDVAIMLMVPDLPGLSSAELYKEDYMVCLPSGHPLAQYDEVSFAQLENEQIIQATRAADPKGYDEIISACTGAGYSPKSLSITGSYLDHAGMVSAGMGVSFAPVSFAHMRPNGVQYRPLVDPRVGMSVSIHWFEDRLDYVGEAFVNHCIKNVRAGDSDVAENVRTTYENSNMSNNINN